MSGKQNKKQRQILRREFRKEYAKKAEEVAEFQTNLFKPKPKYVPLGLWMWALGFFVKIKKTKKI